MPPGSVERRRIHVRGTVQGVGFRPFVYRHAMDLGLSGWVGNDGGGVVLEVEGPGSAVDVLLERLRLLPPPLALVEEIEVQRVPPTGEPGFAIAGSIPGTRTDARVGADVAPCAPCLAEMADPRDRRYGYPFVNCTDCGPRYTIVRDLPYDRATTTMADFAMCPECQAEYDDPTDRRFHAQPIACPACGPAATWMAAAADGELGRVGPAAVAAAVRCLQGGGIVAVKGVGGYHLACDAIDPVAVAELRRRKHRPHKPLAVMVPDIAAARTLCNLDEATSAALVAAPRPVVVAPRRSPSAVADAVAPRVSDLGVMLPSSPLHVLLLQGVGRPLVMTSGNRGGAAVVHRDAEARTVLGPLTDGILAHDREIEVRADDSVLRRTRSGQMQMVRRARGWVPQPLRLPQPTRKPVLAVGAQQKNTVALADGACVVVSQHLGDLGDWTSYAAFRAAVEHLVRLSGTSPALVAHDLHPDYRSTAWAQESGLPVLGVQHHHAHVAACLVEHQVTAPVLGLAFDGTGFGTDGTAWGGEFLVADLLTSSRVGHLLPVVLPGGDAATREPWRMGLSWLHRSVGADAAAADGARLDPRWRSVLSLVVARRARQTTSVGRLFDAVAAVLGVCGRVSYDGQAAVELEALAAGASGSHASYAFATADAILDPRPMFQALLTDRARGLPVEESAARFHRGLADSAADLAMDLAARHHLGTVVLTGGVFQNVLLSGLLAARLEAAGLQVLQHRRLPPNDGAISVGQAAVAAAHSQQLATPAANGTRGEPPCTAHPAQETDGT